MYRSIESQTDMQSLTQFLPVAGHDTILRQLGTKET